MALRRGRENTGLSGDRIPMKTREFIAPAGYRIRMKINTVVLVLFLLGCILLSGCTSPAPDKAVPTVTPVVETVAVTETSAPTPVQAATPGNDAHSIPTVNPITVTETTRIASDNPSLEYLNIRKQTFDYSIPNCVMQTAFPAIITDTYGIKQAEPKLTAISEDDYLAFLRKYTEGNAENTQLKTPTGCFGTAAEPTWNFIELRVVLKPTNIRASDYTITEKIMSDGKVVEEFPVTKRLVIDEGVTLLSYIPIRANEVDLFDSVVVTYTRLN
jgi:hypothetical protein